MLQRLKDGWRNLMYEDATPNKIALGFAVGIFTSFYPAPVVDTVVALALAYMVRGNRAACLFGNGLGLMLFPIIPLVLALEYYIGRTILHVPPAPLTFESGHFLAFLKSHRGTYLSLVVGAIVLSIPSALLGFAVVRSGARYRQEMRRSKS
jgi:uncharacterized protein (DUF2062 family)